MENTVRERVFPASLDLLGDIRAFILEEDGAEVLERRVRDVMTPGPRTVSQESLVAEAYRMLRDFRIDQLPVVDGAGHPVGLIDVQDWLDIERGAAMPDHPPV